MQSLNKADIVYSWGVLRHTGSVGRALGLGRHRVEGGRLFFSTADNSDPNKNNKLYKVSMFTTKV
jgi:hypothetical protein